MPPRSGTAWPPKTSAVHRYSRNLRRSRLSLRDSRKRGVGSANSVSRVRPRIRAPDPGEPPRQRQFLAAMMQLYLPRKAGVAVVVSSVAANSEMAGRTPYAATKADCPMLVRNAANDLYVAGRPDQSLGEIVVNGVAPARVETALMINNLRLLREGPAASRQRRLPSENSAVPSTPAKSSPGVCSRLAGSSGNRPPHFGHDLSTRRARELLRIAN